MPSGVCVSSRDAGMGDAVGGGGRVSILKLDPCANDHLPADQSRDSLPSNPMRLHFEAVLNVNLTLLIIWGLSLDDVGVMTVLISQLGYLPKENKSYSVKLQHYYK